MELQKFENIVLKETNVGYFKVHPELDADAVIKNLEYLIYYLHIIKISKSDKNFFSSQLNLE